MTDDANHETSATEESTVDESNTDQSAADEIAAEDDTAASDATDPVPPDVSDAVAEHAHSLAGSDPDLDDRGLKQLRGSFEGNTVVGLGEATHGTREFFQLKHRFLRYLVEELDYRLFGLEANFAETLAIDRYVRTGEGDLGDALDGIYFWTWNTEEVAALVEWLRSFNEGCEPGDRVRFYGIDAQYTAGPAAALEDYLERVDPDFFDAVAADLAAVDDGGEPPHQADDDALDRQFAAADRLLDRVGERLADQRGAYVDETSLADWELARRQLRTIEQARDGKRAAREEDYETKMRARDRAMAENVDWILDHEDRDRIAVWAHDEHVNRQTVHGAGETAPSMGGHLADRYGDDYYAVGFAFGRGSFQAIAEATEENDVDDPGVRAHEVDGPRPGTVGEAFDAMDEPVAFLDVGDASADDELGPWLGREQRARSVGSTFDPSAPADYYRTSVPAEDFDGLCYVRETERARPRE